MPVVGVGGAALGSGMVVGAGASAVRLAPPMRRVHAAANQEIKNTPKSSLKFFIQGLSDVLASLWNAQTGEYR
jgi:hypothetical protein